MPDILAINATVTAIKHSIDIAKAIKDADSTLQKAELKFRVAELIESLADAKIKATELQGLVQEKDLEIKRLSLLLERKIFSQSFAANTQIDLPKECLEILKLLTKVEELDTSAISQRLQMSEQKTQYFLDKLEEQDLVAYYVRIDVGTMYYLNGKSRKLLFEKDLL
jgi:hypothetical protein